jgi:hypothetical protein
MYQVDVPVRANTWAVGRLISDWSESALEFSNNAMLRDSHGLPVTAEGPLDQDQL